MPYAATGRVSQSEIEGGIVITQEQYLAAVNGMMAGNIVTIDGGFAVIAPPAPEPDPDPEPEPGDRLPNLQPYQFKAMLALSGKQAGLDTFIDALPEPERTVARAKLEYSLVFRRDNELVLGAQVGMGLTSEQLDDLWVQACSIL